MRPHNFYPNMPPGRPFHHFPNHMPHHGFPQHPFPQMPPNFQPPNSGAPRGILPKGVSPKGASTKLDSFMDTANRFLATAQGFQPLIQQASPMIRNLPALWRLYKGFQSAPNNSTEPEQVERQQYSQPAYRERTLRNADSTPQQQTTRPSVPRIFQPPHDF